MKSLLETVAELLKLIPERSRWIVVCAIIAGGVYYMTHRAAQSDSEALIDTYTSIVQFEAQQAANCSK